MSVIDQGRWLRGGAVLALCLILPLPFAPAGQESLPDEPPALLELLEQDGRFGTFLDLVEQAGLLHRLVAAEPLTLVVPIDAAFAALPVETLERLRSPANAAALRELLLFHALDGRWTLADLGRRARHPSLQGQELGLRQLGADRYALDVGEVLEPDRGAADGVLHVVDAVLQPPGLTLIDEAGLFGDGRHSYSVDVAHSSVLFRVMHMQVGAQWGRFTAFAGELVIDSLDPAASEVRLAIDASSIDTGVPARDAYLCTRDFFDTTAHPGISFRSTRVRPRDDGDLDVSGELTLRGVTRPVQCLVRKLGEGRFGPSTYKVGYETEFRVLRSDFGMTFGIPGVAGDEVRLVVALEGERAL